MLINIVIIADNISTIGIHVCLCVKTVSLVISLNVCVHTPMTTSVSRFTFNDVGK